MKTKSIVDAYLSMVNKTIEPVLEHKEEIKTLPDPVEVTETTVPDHLQHIPDMWDHHSEVSAETHKKMQKAFPDGDFTHFPLEQSVDEFDPDVADHLIKHGYEIKDYKKGIATKKVQVGDPARGIPYQEKYVDEKIGSALKKTGATDDVVNAFANDPVRTAGKRTSDLHVVIGTSPLAIAGMSTGTKWKSCMNMQGGINKDYLEQDSMHGTHVAYLVHHDDHTAFKYGEPSKPIARIALKPFHAEDDKNDTIFRAESKTYGDASTAFTNAVHRWSVENYPARKDVEYKKNSEVYDDTGQNAYTSLSKESIEKAIDNGEQIVNDGQSIDAEAINHGLNHIQNKFKEIADNQKDTHGGERERMLDNFVAIGNLNAGHVAKVFRMSKELPDYPRQSLQSRIGNMHGDKMSKSAIDEAYGNLTDFIPKKVLTSPKISDELINKLSVENFAFVRKNRIKPEHVDRIIDTFLTGKSRYPTTVSSVMSHTMQLMNKDHMNKLVDHLVDPAYTKKSSVHNFVMGHSSFDQAMHDKLLKNMMIVGGNRSYDTYDVAKNSKFASLKDVDAGYYNESALMNNNNLPESTQHEIAKRFIKHIENTPSKDSRVHMMVDFTNRKYLHVNTIPENLSKHFDADDYNTLVKKKMWTSFENPQHSTRYMDAVYDHAKEVDDDITKNGDSSGDKHTELLHRIKHYTLQMDNHVYDHAADKRDRDFLGNKEEYDDIHRRVHGVALWLGRRAHGTIDSFVNYEDHPDTEDKEDQLFGDTISGRGRPSNIISDVKDFLKTIKRMGHYADDEEEFL